MSSWRVSSSKKPRKRDAKLLMAVTCLTVAVAPWTGVQVASIPVADVLVVLATAVLCLLWVRGSLTVELRWWMFAPSAASLVVVGADVFSFTSGGGEVTGSDVLFLWRTVMATTVMTVVVGSVVLRRGPAGARTLLTVFVGSIVASVLAIMWWEATGTALVDPPDVDISTRSVGLAFHPNSLAQTLVVGLPAVAALVVLVRSVLWRVLLVVGVVPLLLWGLQMADSRGGFIGAALVLGMLLAYFLVVWDRGRWLVPAAIVALLAAPVMWEFLVAESRLGSGAGSGTEQSNEGRVDFLREGWEAFTAQPIFGAGLGSGAGVMVPVLLLSAGGVVLFAGYTWFVAGAAWDVTTTRSPVPRVVALVVIAAPVLMGFFNNSVNERFDYIPLAVMAGLAWWSQRGVVANEGKDEGSTSSGDTQRPPVSRWRR